MIQMLSILSLLPYIVSACNYSLFILDTVTNKLRRPVIATLSISILSTVTTILLLKYTNLGIYAVAGVSSIYWIFKVVIFNNINAAKNLRIKWNAFFGQFIKNSACLVLVMLIFQIIKMPFQINSWFKLAMVAIMAAIIGYIIAFIFLFSRQEKRNIKTIIMKRIKKVN